jgi:type II secretory pathway component PulK
MKFFRPANSGLIRNERGVALLIVLLVTALLIALIFEFSYATRISLNSAVNFRNSERAGFLAFSGINAFKTHGAQLRKMIPAGTEYPFGEGDTKINVLWEDEQGKIRITDVKTDPVTQSMARTLFENKGIDYKVYDTMTDQASEINKLTLLSGLHAYMSDEDFIKVRDSLTVSPVAPHTININAASADVLRSMGVSADAAERIVKNRKEKPYTQQDITSDGISGISGLKIPPATGNFVKAYLTANEGQIIKVYSHATVGDYTKRVDAILNGNAVTYWSAL